MTREQLLSRIAINPNVCFGKPCIRGHRIWVSLILDFLASGMTIEEVIKEYPDLEQADIFACLAYNDKYFGKQIIKIWNSKEDSLA